MKHDETRQNSNNAFPDDEELGEVKLGKLRVSEIHSWNLRLVCDQKESIEQLLL